MRIVIAPFAALVAFGCSSEDVTAPPRGTVPSASASASAMPAPTGSASPLPAATTDGGPAVSPPNRVKGLVGVGYGGLRITSRDGGRSWTSRTSAAHAGGDDFDLLRAVAYANGKWLATGWGASMSDDGVTWTPIARINQPGGVTWQGAPTCGIVEGLASDGAAFFAVCYDDGDSVYRSTDGAQWKKVGTIGELGGHSALAYRAGTFFAYGDAGASFRSTDGGTTWERVAGLVQATYCEGQWRSKTACRDASWFDGAYFQAVWQSEVSRAEGAGPFVVVHDDISMNTLYDARAMAEGLVAR